MGDIAIRVDGLGKQYRIGASQTAYTTLRDTLSNTVARLAQTIRGNHSRPERDSIWALKDVAFDVKHGEVLGIIGRNGAGKSTLLKILSRITEPTCGEVDIFGRVGSLLEVGTGFHPELTGRENIYLNGAVLGMRRQETRAKFDEIVAFAEVEKFIDMPVKHYSSGMYMRLAFAVAAHLEPEILIVDEVLAVGDAEFQKKCLGKMSDAAHQGRTVLFVSHNMQAVSTLTQRCMILDKGIRTYSGATELAIQEYLNLDGPKPRTYTGDRSGTEPSIVLVELLTSEPDNVHVHGRPLNVRFVLNVPDALRGAALSFQIVNQYQQPMVHLWLLDSERPFGRAAGKFEVICRIPKSRLYMGHYSLVVHFSARSNPAAKTLISGICPFEVVMYGHQREFRWDREACVYIEDSDWSIRESQAEFSS